LVALKEMLSRHGVTAKTYRADEGIQLDTLLSELPLVQEVVLVLERPGDKGWCARNSGRISMAANEAGIPFRAISHVYPVQVPSHVQT
jgi:hypothetical protein